MSSGNAPQSDGSRGRGRGRGGPRRGRGGNNGGNTGARQESSGFKPSNPLSTSDLSARFQSNSVQPQPQPQSQTQTQSIPTTQTSTSSAGAEEDEDVEAEVCFICASPVVHNSVAPCNHRTCHICAIRMRALYKTKDCAHCRTEAEFVIFTDDATKRYEDFEQTEFADMDTNIGIKYENREIVEDTVLLLRYNCPEATCDEACRGWPDLHRHVRGTHHKKMCDLCTRNKKVFTHEHELFTDKELERHMKKGDDAPGAIDQSGFRGHPICGFCGQRFYGDDELYVHCRDKHERCFLCDRNENNKPQYYLNYDTLELHFRKDHFLCPDRACLEKKFTVFGSEMDLKAHQLQEHGDTLSKDVRRDARHVDISSFDYRAPYVQERRGGASQRENRSGRGRDPNADPIPASSAQPLSRSELAYQRQMAIQSAQSVTTRTFGGQLTSAPTPAAARAPAGSQAPATVTAKTPSTGIAQVTDELSYLDISSARNVTGNPQDQARRLRHSVVIERASNLLQNDAMKIQQFRNSISAYQHSTITAAALIDGFFALFDTSSGSLGSLIREVAELYEEKAKSQALVTAWNDWRAINEDYPSLPGPSGLRGQSVGWAAVTASTPSPSPVAPPKSTSRVLKLKSSTAQSSRSSASRQQSWGTSSTSSASAGGNAFPGLPAVAGPAPRSTQSRASASPWLAHASGPHSAANSAPSSARATPPSSRPASRLQNAPAINNSAFPTLPPAAKPTSTIFGYGTGRGVRRDAGGSSSNFQWGASTAMDDAIEEPSDGANGQGRKKGNKGKKVLVQWG